MTTRERLEAKAEKRRQWAESRARKADASQARVHQIADGIPFGQPILVGHHSERHHRRDIARIENGMRATIDNARAADDHNQKADGLEHQLSTSIYSDDPDAAEALEAKATRLEAKRDAMKAANAAYRKEHAAELRAMTAYERDQAIPFASYSLTNLGATIRTTRARIADVQKRAAILEAGGRGRGKPMLSRYPGACPDCGQPIDKGSPIVYYRLTREAIHADCG